MISDFCEWFKDIEADPHRIVAGLSVREFLLAREHMAVCSDCSDLVDRVLAGRDTGNGGIEASLN